MLFDLITRALIILYQAYKEFITNFPCGVNFNLQLNNRRTTGREKLTVLLTELPGLGFPWVLLVCGDSGIFRSDVPAPIKTRTCHVCARA